MFKNIDLENKWWSVVFKMKLYLDTKYTVFISHNIWYEVNADILNKYAHENKRFRTMTKSTTLHGVYKV
jgi:hypothetical protein